MTLSTIFRSAWSPSPTRSSAAVGVAATLARLSASLAVLKRLGIDRETEVAADRAAVGAGEFGTARGVYENRLADHRRVKPVVAVAIGLADDLRIAASEPAGKKGRDVCDLPRGQVCADDERCLGAVHHAAHPSVAAGAVLNVRAR